MKNDVARGNWLDRWYEVFNYIIPEKDSVYDWQYTPGGERKYGKLYDSSAIHYNELLASALHSMLTNPSTQWFELTTGDRELDTVPKVKSYLQKLVKSIHGYLNNSNFHSEIHEIYLDLGAAGTSVLLMEEDDTDVVKFRAEPIYKYFMRENFKGDIDTISTELKLTVRQAFQRYGEEVFGDRARELSGDLDKEITVIHLIMPRTEVKFGRKDKKNKPLASYHIWPDNKILLLESGFNTWPIATPRWMKVSGEIYGRSAGLKALPDIKMLNAMMKTVIRAAQKVVDPPLLVPDDGIAGKVNTAPGGLISYRAGTQDRIFPLETGGNIGIGLEIIQNVRERVKQNFFIDQLQLNEGPQMTATEVNQRTEEHLRLLGPILGRLNNELLKPLISRILDIFKVKNLMPADIPSELLGRNVEVYFSSQIARAQRLGEIQNIDTFIMGVANFAQFDPNILQFIEPHRYLKTRADIQGVPNDIFRTEEELAALAEQKAQEQQAMLAQQQQLADAEVMQKTGQVASEQ